MKKTHTIKAEMLSLSRDNRPLLNELSFELSAGNLLCVTGANGTGKSTLLRVLTGLIRPDTGNIYWCDTAIHETTSDYLGQFHYVGHANGLKFGLTVSENLHLMGKLGLMDPAAKPRDDSKRDSNDGAKRQGVAPHCSTAQAKHVQEKCGARTPSQEPCLLDPRFRGDDSFCGDDRLRGNDNQARSLSQGQRRRLALAKLSLCLKPLWILDEPLTALDSIIQAAFLLQLEKHLQQGGLAIISTHQTMPFREMTTHHIELAAC